MTHKLNEMMEFSTRLNCFYLYRVNATQDLDQDDPMLR